ncbi:MAG: tRNA 2-thiocytidine biosynthesis protein TtcA [Bacilli bacterium]|nr:tRNA 2-thiocytidine biosynthesis protein TtcA [Bacilli bacterium]
MEKYKEVERSIIKKYRKELFRPFVRALDKYKLIKENDKIAVCISGGKDSFLMAKLFQEIKNHGKIKFDLEFICMDPGYNKENRKLIEENSKLLNIPIKIFSSDVFEVADKVSKESPCYLCARMRRGYLYSKAKELGCNKIALGHHFDDVIETILLNLFYGCEIKSMMPKLHSTNFEGLELIRPLYLIKEDDIIAWKNFNELKFLNCACKFTEEYSKDERDSKRYEMKYLIKELKKKNKNVDVNIFTAMENINLDTIVRYKKGGKEYNFLDDYE